MRDSLTFLAGLVLLALLGALVGPIFVDWNQHRSAIEEQLRRATGIEMVTTGPIHVRFLPSPRLKISGLRVGDADPQGTRATAAVLRAEMELAPLLGGTLKLSSLELDGVDLRLALRDGALALPEAFNASVVIPGIERLAVTRGQLSLLSADGGVQAAVPFSLEASLPQSLGPSRVDGEVAGRSLRLTTGDRDPSGRLRIKLASSDAHSRAEFDGWLGTEKLAGGRVGFLPDGQLLVALLKSGEAQAPVTVSGRLQGGNGLALGALVVDAGAAGRLEGDAAWSGDWQSPAIVRLQSRRTDLGQWLAGEGGLEQAAQGLGWLAARLPDVDLRLAVDQVSYRGEEATDGQLVLQRRGAIWRPASGQLRFAGASAQFQQAPGGALQAGVDVPDMRRIALAMQRLDMPQGLAEDIAALGQLNATADVAEAGGGWRIQRWQADGRFGQASGDGLIETDRVRIGAAFSGADVLFLVRPLLAMTQLSGADLDVAVSGQAMRIGAGPTGSGQVQARRLGGHWRVDAVSARGFDGVELDLKRRAPSEPLQISLRAARADAISAVAERFTASQQVTQGLRAMRGLSPVMLEGILSERGEGWSVATTGLAGALALEGRAQFDRAGRWQSGDVVLSAGQRGVLFRTLGLPEPAAGAVATRLGARLGTTGPVLVLTGPDGLSIEARGAWAPGQAGVLAAPLDVTIEAPSLRAVLPAFADVGDAAEALSGTFKLAFGENGISFEGIDARLGGAPVRGQLALAGDGSASGQLTLPSVDVARIGRWLTAGAVLGPDGAWSSARFGPAPALPNMAIGIASEAFQVPLLGQMSGRTAITVRDGAVSLSGIDLAAGRLAFKGAVEGERSGGQLALRASGEIGGLDLGKLRGGDFSGTARIAFQLGAAGESPARLVASLTGAGQVEGRAVTIGRLDQAALDRIAASLGSDIAVSDAATLAQNVRRSVEAGSWQIANGSWPFVIAGGLARLSPFGDDKPAAALTLAGSYDVRSDGVDLRAAMQSRTAPKGWAGPQPQIAIVWRGPWREPQRSYDVSALSNAVSQRALQREIERVDALEADIRERAAFNRRLRAERERREEEQRQAAAEAQRAAAEAQRAAAEAKARDDRLREERIAEERARAIGLQVVPQLSPAAQPRPPVSAPALPPPLNINPIPAPLSRPVAPLN